MRIDATHYAAGYLIIQQENGQLLGHVTLLEWDPQTQEGFAVQFSSNGTTEVRGKFGVSLMPNTPLAILKRWAREAYPLDQAEFERQIKLNRAMGRTGFDVYPKITKSEPN